MVEFSEPRTGHAGSPVAFLDLRHAAHEYDGRDSESSKLQIPIHPNEEFYFGRESLESKYNPPPTMSKRHLKFHCILFDTDGQWGVQPLVYANDISTNSTYLKRAQTLDTVMMRPHAQTTLLEDDDELWVTPMMFLRYCVDKDHRGKDRAFSPEVQMDMKVISRRYQVESRVIGEGGYGAVHVAIHRKTQRQLACKLIDLNFLHRNGRDMEKLTREFEVLRDLDHPNIIKLEKVYHSDSGLYIFQELIPGGDLFSFVTNRHEFGVPTIEAAVIVYQILKGVDYLHENGIAHRDIKPDNILLTSTKTACRVVITDFGQARYLPEAEENAAQRMVTMAGTLGFNAPEIFRRNPKVAGSSGYSKVVDIWSVGCVAGLLLSGKPIFHDNDAKNQEIAVKMLSSKCNLDILENDPVWQRVGHRAKDFIRQTVVLDENDRLDAKEALQHEWFSSRAYADELQAVYQHVTKDWEPQRKIFKIIEHIPTSRPKMELNTSKFFSPATLPEHRSLPVVDLLSGQSPVMPIIDEEAICPGASSAKPSSTDLGGESEIPRPPQSWGDSPSEEESYTVHDAATHATQQSSTEKKPPAADLVQQDSNDTKHLGQENHGQQQLTSTQLLTQNYHEEKQNVLHDANSLRQRDLVNSFMPGHCSDEENMQRRLTHLSLSEQQDKVNTDWQGTRQPSFDFDQDMSQDAYSQQRYGAPSSGKRQPSFDFDQDMNDAGFWEAAVTAEFKQPTAKRLRTG